MQIYDGAVLFVDILGISALTTSKKPLVNRHDFDALNGKTGHVESNQLFCANMLSQFRKNLNGCKMPDLRIAQLSDCAFLWSSEVDLVVLAAQKLFMENAETGIFARGGMTYGQIIEPDKTDISLGRFVCGEAVTKAAKLEGTGKGSRVFIDRKIGGRQFCDVSPRAFEGLPNPSDYRVVDEFLWFSCPKCLETPSGKANRLTTLLGLIGRFRYAPSFRWNAGSAPGRVHLGATIERLSVATRELAREMDIEEPHFALQTSEIFQDLYHGDQHSVESHNTFGNRVSNWLKQHAR